MSVGARTNVGRLYGIGGGNFSPPPFFKLKTESPLEKLVRKSLLTAESPRWFLFAQVYWEMRRAGRLRWAAALWPSGRGRGRNILYCAACPSADGEPDSGERKRSQEPFGESGGVLSGGKRIRRGSIFGALRRIGN